MLRRIMAVCRTLPRDLWATLRLAADARSRLRLSADFVLSRGIALIPGKRRNRGRHVRLRDGIRISYRLNKGDLHSIREIWFQQAYRLPFDLRGGTLLDAGANIGMTSVCLARKFGFERVIAVEPDPDNAALARRNLEQNGIAAQVLGAALGSATGRARFERSAISNLGRLAQTRSAHAEPSPELGFLVPVVTVDEIMRQFVVREFALVKMDIEGAEKDLFDGPLDWLAHVRAMVMEFHPPADRARIISLLQARGFTHIPAHSLPWDNLDCFTKSETSRQRKE